MGIEKRFRVMKINSIVDCHVHCDFSDDSGMLPRQGVDSAVAYGLKGIAYTDHIDIDYPDPSYDFTFDIAARTKSLNQLQKQYEGRLSIINGVEIGIQPSVIKQSNEFVTKGNFDFVICAVHSVDHYSLCMSSKFFEGKSKKKAYRRYLEAVYDSVTHFDDFDIVGHIGYVRRYGPYEDRSMPYAEFSDIIDMILKRVIDDGRGIEVNTSGYAYNLGSPIPDFDIIERYKELGGKIITIGSDAHDPKCIGARFLDTLKRVHRIGFKSVAYYEQRKPVFVYIG